MHVVLNQRDIHFSDIMIDFSSDGLTGELYANNESWPLENFVGVYTRIMGYDAASREPDRASGKGGQGFVLSCDLQ